MIVEIYTDGAITGNGKPGAVGGWGAILTLLSKGVEVHRKELSGGKIGTTNNEMELMAVYEGLRSLDPAKRDNFECHVFSDSEYVVKAFQYRADRWEKDGWRNRPNLDLIKQILKLSRYYKVYWHWVRGHNGNVLNERADELAVQAKMELLGRLDRDKSNS